MDRETEGVSGLTEGCLRCERREWGEGYYAIWVAYIHPSVFGDSSALQDTKKGGYAPARETSELTSRI